MSESRKDLIETKIDDTETAAVDEPRKVSDVLLEPLLLWTKFTPVVRLTLLMSAMLMLMGFLLVLLMV